MTIKELFWSVMQKIKLHLEQITNYDYNFRNIPTSVMVRIFNSSCFGYSDSCGYTILFQTYV